jgi:hypothetical protein
MNAILSSIETTSPIAEFVRQAALETADPVAIVTEALTMLASDPGALYENHVIAALKTIRQKDEAAYTRLCAQAKGCMTKLDKLTAPERESRQDNVQDEILQVAQNSCTFNHDADGRCIAIIAGETHREVYYVDGSGFNDWLRAAYFSAHKKGIGDLAISTALSTLSAIGKHQGAEQKVHMRCAKSGNAYFIDLCDDKWRAIRVDANGWEIVDKPPTLITRTKNMRPLPAPQTPAQLDKLWDHLNIPENRRLLLLAWILDSYRPDTPFPILELCGEQGSAKSSAQRHLRDLIDPNKVPLRGRPKSVEDIYVGAANNWLVSFENLSHLTPEQQDALCTLSTGGGFATRQFYTNGDEHVLESKRPVVINGINPVASQPDLIERVISIEAPVIPPDQRKDEQTLEAAWQEDYPSILAGLMDLFADALRLLPSIKLTHKHRMADYQLLGEAVAQAQGHPAGHFSTRYAAAVNEGIDRSLETYGIANALQVFTYSMKNPWEGNYLSLLGDLNLQMGIDRSHWPKSVKGFANQLKRITPGLRRRGISIEALGHGRNGSALRITLSATEQK